MTQCLTPDTNLGTFADGIILSSPPLRRTGQRSPSRRPLRIFLAVARDPTPRPPLQFDRTTIPEADLKQCSEDLSRPVSQLFRRAFRHGRPSLLWKLASVVPVHKKGSKSVTKNYRPISLSPSLSNVMEAIVNRSLMGFLERNHNQPVRFPPSSGNTGPPHPTPSSLEHSVCTRSSCKSSSCRHSRSLRRGPASRSAI